MSAAVRAAAAFRDLWGDEGWAPLCRMIAPAARRPAAAVWLATFVRWHDRAGHRGVRRPRRGGEAGLAEEFRAALQELCVHHPGIRRHL